MISDRRRGNSVPEKGEFVKIFIFQESVVEASGRKDLANGSGFTGRARPNSGEECEL
jgi:hypothetical protein